MLYRTYVNYSAAHGQFHGCVYYAIRFKLVCRAFSSVLPRNVLHASCCCSVSVFVCQSHSIQLTIWQTFYYLVEPIFYFLKSNTVAKFRDEVCESHEFGENKSRYLTNICPQLPCRINKKSYTCTICWTGPLLTISSDVKCLISFCTTAEHLLTAVSKMEDCSRSLVVKYSKHVVVSQ